MSLKNQLLQSPSLKILELKQLEYLKKHPQYSSLERHSKRAESAHAFTAHRAALHMLDDIITGHVKLDCDVGPTSFSRHPTDGRQRNQILILDTHIPLTNTYALANNAITALFTAYTSTAKHYPAESGASGCCMILNKTPNERDRTRTSLSREIAIVIYDIPHMHDLQEFFTNHRHEITEALRKQFSLESSKQYIQ